MVGRLVDVEGLPVTGVRIQTEEHGSVTDEQGKFAVQYKEPSQYVHFYHQGLWYKRLWQGEQDSERVVLKLPAVRDMEMFCDLDFPCEVEYEWELADHLTAVARSKCLPEITTGLASVPMGAPKVICRNSSGAPIYPRFELQANRVTLLSPPATIRVSVQGSKQKTPKNCDVAVAGEKASAIGGGMWMGSSVGMTSITAICDGIPAVPRYVRAKNASRVILQWYGRGPRLALPPEAPKFESLVLQLDSMKGGWRIEIPEQSGVFSLPPLARGDYRFFLGDADKLMKLNLGDPLESNRVVWKKQDVGYIGSLKLLGPKLDGELLQRNGEWQ